jgi:hypothetical protein
MKNSILIKNTATGELKEVSYAAWDLMISDGRSRKYSVVPDDVKLYIEPEKEEVEKIEIKPVFTKRKKKEDQELNKDELKDELTNEGTD